MLIALVIPNKDVLGIFQRAGPCDDGIIFDGHRGSADRFLCGERFIHSTEKSFFILELPVLSRSALEKRSHHDGQQAKIFVRDAGKVIIVISMILWALSTYGPPGRMHAVANRYTACAGFRNERTKTLPCWKIPMPAFWEEPLNP